MVLIFSNKFLEKIILPSSDALLGFSVSKSLNFLTKSQWWTRQQIDEFQNEKLRELIKHSYENVPYYNELFKSLNLTPGDIKSKDDLYKIPVLTKGDIRRNYPDKLTAKNLKSESVMNSTSGSTGEPLKYFETKETISFRNASGIRAWHWMNYKLGDRYIKISKHPRTSMVKTVQDLLNNCSYFSFHKLSENIFTEILDKIERIDPRIIRGYPTAILYMAELIEKRGGIRLPGLKAISTTASTLHPYMRKKIEEVFNTTIYDSYSCEGSALFSQCENLEHYHPSEELAISEFLEDQFSKNDHEHSKRHITTHLFNYVHPFIRYDTQDYMVTGNENKCSCGRNLLNIAKIKGRDNAILVLPNGDYVFEMDFIHYFYDSETVDQFQVIQEKKDLIRLKVVTNKSFSNNNKRDIINYWNDFLGDSVKLSVEVVDTIELTPSGKRRFLIRNPEIKIGSLN